jgi:hypothetical protein
VHFHDVLGEGDGVGADDHAEDGAIVGEPSAPGGVGGGGVIEGGDATPGAPLGGTEGTVVDEHTAPGEEPPVDAGVGVGEERRPPRLHGDEQVAFAFLVTRGRGQVPGDQVVGDALPRTVGEVRVGTGVGPSDLPERLDEGPLLVAAGEEAHEVGDEPGVAGIARAGHGTEGVAVHVPIGEGPHQPIKGGVDTGLHRSVGRRRCGGVVELRGSGLHRSRRPVPTAGGDQDHHGQEPPGPAHGATVGPRPSPAGPDPVNKHETRPRTGRPVGRLPGAAGGILGALPVL